MVKKVMETSAKTFWVKNERIGLRKKGLKQGQYRIDDADTSEINPILHCVFG